MISFRTLRSDSYRDQRSPRRFLERKGRQEIAEDAKMKNLKDEY